MSGGASSTIKALAAYQQYVKLDPAAVMRLVENKNSKRYKNGIKIVPHCGGVVNLDLFSHIRNW